MFFPCYYRRLAKGKFYVKVKDFFGEGAVEKNCKSLVGKIEIPRPIFMLIIYDAMCGCKTISK